MAIPKPKVFWPIVIGNTNKYIDLLHNTFIRQAVIAVGTYYSATSLAAAVESALNAVSGGGFFFVTVDAQGVVTIRNDTAAFTLKWSSGAQAANSARYLLGWYAADAPSTGGSPNHIATAPRQHSNGWYSPVAVRRDSKDFTEDANSVQTVSQAGQNKSLTGPRHTWRELTFAKLPATHTRIADDTDTVDGRRAIENWWLTGRARFRYWPDASVEGTSADYFFDTKSLEEFAPSRLDAAPLFSLPAWKLRRFVA